MPIYEYRCPACSQTFELLIRSSRDEQETVCPSCGERRVERKLSTFAAPAAAAAGRSLAAPRGGGCGRCGDPDGPCAVDG